MRNKRWTPTKKRPTAAEQRAAQQEKALADCQQGRHLLTPTFRAGEHVCTSCGTVLYCPECLMVHHLPATHAERAYPLACATHTKAQVQV
jgi:hypothetical protein